MGTPDLNLLFQYNIPFRAIAKMTGGLVSMDMIRGILLVINGQFLKGMRQVITGFFVNRRENRRYEAVLTGKGKIMEGIRNWVKAHPNLWEFILFNLLSNCATIINFIVMWLCTGFIFTAFNTRPFQFFIFRYTNVDRDLGLCGFLSFLVATAVAQTVNFLCRRIWCLNQTQPLKMQFPNIWFWQLLLWLCRRRFRLTARQH